MAKGITFPGYEGEPRTFPGVPSPVGGYGPGVVLPLSSAGMTAAEAKAAIEGTPLELVDLPKQERAKAPAEPIAEGSDA